MKKNKILLFLSMFVMLSCSEKQVWQEIETGKTIKVFPEGLKTNNTATKQNTPNRKTLV